jgi:laccase
MGAAAPSSWLIAFILFFGTLVALPQSSHGGGTTRHYTFNVSAFHSSTN